MFDVAKKFYGVVSDWKLFEFVEESTPYKEWAAYHGLDGWKGIMAYLSLFFEDSENGFSRILADPYIRYRCFLRYANPDGKSVEVISKDTQEGFPTIYNCSMEGLSEGQRKEIEKIVGDYPDYSIPDFPDDVVDEDGELLTEVVLKFCDIVSMVSYIDPKRLIKPLGITAEEFRFIDFSEEELRNAVDWEVENINDFLDIEKWF